MFGWERNNFDRIVHFSYGFLLAYPLREIFLRVADARGFWGYFLPLDVALSTSALYELVDWMEAEGFGGDLGFGCRGTQGDLWHETKDRACAGLVEGRARVRQDDMNADMKTAFTIEEHG